jgi:hypothetical protein
VLNPNVSTVVNSDVGTVTRRMSPECHVEWLSQLNTLCPVLFHSSTLIVLTTLELM